MYINRKTDKVAELLTQEKRVFRTPELSVLWQIQNKNTLLTTISRYVKRGVLYSVKKGVYSTTPIEKLHSYELGCALCGPLSYVTGETILSREGAMSQPTSKITLMGKKAGEWKRAGRTFWCRYASSISLVNREGIIDKIRWSEATPIRAKADLRRVNPKVYLDKENI